MNLRPVFNLGFFEFLVAVIWGTVLLVGRANGQDVSDWHYQFNIQPVRATSRSIELTTNCPQELTLKAQFTGTQQFYAQLRYGSENSRRVAFVVDIQSDDTANLFADLDRDRSINSSDQIPGTGLTWNVEVPAEIISEDRPSHEPRQLEVRLSSTRDRLSVSTLGCIEGSINLAPAGDEQFFLKVQRIDGDANGLFSDSKDRILVDLNNDGQWQLISEQSPFLPILKLKNARYAVHSDRFGREFRLAEVTGTGNLQLVLSGLSNEYRVTAFEAMVFGDDGAVHSIDSLGKPVSIPVGNYALGSFSITVESQIGEPWHFVFSRYADVSNDQWRKLEKDSTVVIEMLGNPRFVLERRETKAVEPGRSTVILPRLFSEDGLLINLCSRGKQMGSFDDESRHQLCQIELKDSRNNVLCSAKSGFN